MRCKGERSWKKKIEKNVEELSKKEKKNTGTYIYVFSEMSDNDYKNEAQMMVIMIVVGY